jgi:hypothetical protein
MPTYKVSQAERSIFWEVTVSVTLSKICISTCVLFQMVSEIELFHCTAVWMYVKLHSEKQHAIYSRVAKCTDVDGRIFENVIY